MLNSYQVKNFPILIIDTDKEFNNRLTYHLKQYGYDIDQAFTQNETQEKIKTYADTLQLIILNLNIQDNSEDGIFDFIRQTTDCKVIILSERDIGLQRESYFEQGILDYFITSYKVHHISNDIHKMIQDLQENQKETILIIDASISMLNRLQTILEKRSYNILTATNAQEGIELLKNHEIGVLILDMELPETNGLSILEGLRDLYLLDGFFVLAVSSSNESSTVRDALKRGAKNFLKKPFSYEEFLLKVDLLVKESRAKQTVNKQKREIENSLKSFQELLHATINPMFIFENDTCIDCNTEAVELLELNSIHEVYQMPLIEIFQNVSKEHQNELLDDATNHYFEDVVVSASGKNYNVQVKERNVVIDRKPVKLISIMDITQIKRNEKIISQQSKMASMGEMIGNIAHQWRQPLTAISVAAGGIQLNYELGMEDQQEILKELENIINNTRFLSDTIEDFQNYLKNDRTRTQFFIQHTIHKTLAIIQANIESHEIYIVQKYHENKQLEGIENDLVQVLLNIINNAIDVLKVLDKKKKRKVLIETKFDNNFMSLNIYDSGGGVPNEISDKIFDPYFTTKHQSQGTGLGLYMTHQIIEKIGGSISVMNDEFETDGEKYFGAKFMLQIPLVFPN